jgi:16S rRNA (guanine966-N2)-methyltransferase
MRAKLQFYRSVMNRPSRSSLRKANAQRVRIIGGRHRGRLVRFPAAPGLRPTPDRVRETLFNWLGQELGGWRTLDLYAGSGVLSLEAVSRGAALAVAVDRNPALIRALEATALAFGVQEIEVHAARATEFLAHETRTFDVVFLDPPFDTDPWLSLLPACAPRLAQAGFIYAEASREIAAPEGLRVWRHAKAGAVHYHLLQREAAAG